MHGVKAIILYPDPKDFSGQDQGGEIYPEGAGLPKNGIIWSNVKMIPGDPSTPNFSSSSGITRYVAYQNKFNYRRVRTSKNIYE